MFNISVIENLSEIEYMNCLVNPVYGDAKLHNKTNRFVKKKYPYLHKMYKDSVIYYRIKRKGLAYDMALKTNATMISASKPNLYVVSSRPMMFIANMIVGKDSARTPYITEGLKALSYNGKSSPVIHWYFYLGDKEFGIDNKRMAQLIVDYFKEYPGNITILVDTEEEKKKLNKLIH